MLKKLNRHEYLLQFVDDSYEPTKQPEPTHTPRGSWERIEVYRSRYENGEVLFHPKDSQATWDRRLIDIRMSAAVSSRS